MFEQKDMFGELCSGICLLKLSRNLYHVCMHYGDIQREDTIGGATHKNWFTYPAAPLAFVFGVVFKIYLIYSVRIFSFMAKYIKAHIYIREWA